MDFDTWYDIFFERVRKRGYGGPVDKASFLELFQADITPESAADDFVGEDRADNYPEFPDEWDGPA